MPDQVLFDALYARTPKFNSDIVNGLAIKHLEEEEYYLDRILRTAECEFPPELKYIGLTRCTPEEEYREVVRRLTSASKTVELAPSDIYMAKILFSFQDEPLPPCPIYLPFVRKAGLIRIRGSVFAVSPVMTDKAISVGPDYLFVPLNRAKMMFHRMFHQLVINGKREAVYVYHSLIYNLNDKQKKEARDKQVNGFTTLGHYLFAKFGVRQTFAQYCNTDIIVGDETYINETNFPTDDWVIFSSTMFKPVGVKDRAYVGSRIRVAIQKEHYNLTTTSLLGAFFYVADHFPQRVLAEYINESDVESEKRMWQTLLGLLLFGCPHGEGKLIEDIQNHIKSLDTYIDSEAKTTLRSDDVYCEDLYGLLMHVIETFSTRVTQSGSRVSSLYDKRLVILRYLLKDIILAINTFMFKMAGDKRKVLSRKEVENALRYHLKPNLIMRINRGHGEVNPTSTPSDNMLHKITSQVTQQSDSSRSKTKKANQSDPSKFLHVSIAEVGSYNAVSKSEPTGRSRLNPHVRLSPDGTILRDPAKADFLDYVQQRITI